MSLRQPWTALLILAGVAACAWSQPVAAEPNPNLAELPDSSLVDYGALLPARPAGYLSVDGTGHFVWPDGQRARFWGINVASDSVFQPQQRIETALQRIKRAGFNLVRLHHIDGTGRGLIVGNGNSHQWDDAKLALLDYWIYRCGQLGLSVYLDLLDYRGFLPGDGLASAEALGRGAKPYAIWDSDLIALQKVYARRLLRDHHNRFNGQAYADDPTVVLVELYDENGLFIRRRDLPTLVARYKSDLTDRWNGWLAKRYRDTAGLVAAWSASGVAQPLAEGQVVESATVPLPAFDLATPSPPATAADRLKRLQASDFARFAHDLHRDYYRGMRDYLRRDLGVKVPISAVGDYTILPDLLAQAGELDFIGTNFYWDHPAFQPGNDWQMPFLFHQESPLLSSGRGSFVQVLSMARMAGRPLVVREWNYCAPSPWRAAGMVEATAYAALQDVDAMILFTYGLVPTTSPIGWFDCHADPLRWGLAGGLGAAFLRGGISAAKHRVEIAHSDAETFDFTDYRSDLRQLAMVSRVANRCYDNAFHASADLTIASGRAGQSRLTGGPLLLRRLPGEARNGERFFGMALTSQAGKASRLAFDGWLLAGPGPQPWGDGQRFVAAEIQANGWEPVGSDGRNALGFWDAAKATAGFAELSADQTTRAALDLMARLYGVGGGRAAQVSGRYRSDTGEIDRDPAAGRITVVSPTFAAVAGKLDAGQLQLGPLELTTSNPRGAVLVQSLDGKPLASTERLVIKSVSEATNSEMVAQEPGPLVNGWRWWTISSLGTGPVLTMGNAAPRGLVVRRNGKEWLVANQSRGTCELLRDDRGWQVWSDTPGTSFTVDGQTYQWPNEGAATAP